MIVKNLLLLGSVAFGVSFGIGLLVNRDFNKAFLTGLIAVPATICGAVVVSRKERTQKKLTLTELEFQIYQLERWETQLNHSLAAMAAAERRTENNLDYLQSQLSQLSLQTAEQQRYKQQLNQDLFTLSEQRSQMEAESQHWQAQIYNLEQRKGELDLSLRSLKAEKQAAEAGLNSLQVELKRLQLEIAEQQHQKKELDRDVTLLKRIKPQLETESYNLRAEIQELEKHKTELEKALSAIASQKQATEAGLHSLQTQLSQLQTQVDKVKQESITPQQKRQPGEEDRPSEILNKEWHEFLSRLSNSELLVLKAIAQQDNPSTAIKKIAEENITMPELLIAAINEQALATIGDLIIEPASVPPVIAEAEYLTNVKKMLKIN